MQKLFSIRMLMILGLVLSVARPIMAMEPQPQDATAELTQITNDLLASLKKDNKQEVESKDTKNDDSAVKASNKTAVTEDEELAKAIATQKQIDKEAAAKASSDDTKSTGQSADSSSDSSVQPQLQEELQKLQTKLQSKKAELAGLQAQRSMLSQQAVPLQLKIEELTTKLDNANNDIDTYKQNVVNAKNDLTTSRNTLLNTQHQLINANADLNYQASWRGTYLNKKHLKPWALPTAIATLWAYISQIAPHLADKADKCDEGALKTLLGLLACKKEAFKKTFGAAKNGLGTVGVAIESGAVTSASFVWNASKSGWNTVKSIFVRNNQQATS
jgi:hypothetical protein